MNCATKLGAAAAAACLLLVWGCSREPARREAGGATATYEVTIAVTTDSGRLGALQFDVQIVGDSGSWIGEGGAVACESAGDVALSSFNDRDDGRVSAAMVDLEGFATPGPVAKCRLSAGGPITADSFRVTAVDASNPNLEPTVTFPSMAVTGIVEIPSPDDGEPGTATTESPAAGH